MTLYQFNQLDEAEQLEAIWGGSLLDERADEQHKILLYQIDCFYVEAYYRKDHGELVRFRSFSSTDQLEPYTGKIDISGLTG